VKNDSSSFKATKRNNKCDAEKLKQYFHDHFNTATDINNIPDELKEAPEYIRNLQNTTDINHAPPSIQEIKGVLKTLKNGKASTDIPAEFFKYASDSIELLTELHSIFSEIWETKLYLHHGHTPNSLLFGKGQPKDLHLIQNHTEDYKLEQYSAKS